MIESQIKSFGLVKKTEGSRYEQKGETQTESYKFKEKFTEKASEMRLTITTAGFGLGKDKEATLVSYDIESFKKGIQDAFKAMQNPLTGKVISIEVIPWVENTEFQNTVKLNETIKIPATKSESGSVTAEKVLQPYQMKHNISENAEFLAEIKKNDRNLLNIYYKSKMCKSYFDTNWRINGKLKDKYANQYLLNHRTGEKKAISELDTKLNDAYVESLYDKEQEFMYTGENSASKCINAIITDDIRAIHYRDIKDCTTLVKRMGNIEGDLIDDYCMPVITSAPEKESK